MNTVQDEWFFLRSFRFMHMSLHDPIHGKFYQKKSKYRTHVLGNFPISFFINVESVLSLFLGSNLVGEIFLTKPKWQWKSTVCAHVYIEHIITYTSVKYCICCLENDLWCLMVLLCRFPYVQFIFCFYFSLSSDPKKKEEENEQNFNKNKTSRHMLSMPTAKRIRYNKMTSYFPVVYINATNLMSQNVKPLQNVKLR